MQRINVSTLLGGLTLPAFLLLSATGLAGEALTMEDLQSQITESRLMTDRLWVLIAAAMVFLMQGGFLMLEVGLVQKKNGASMAVKNMIDWVVLSAAFFCIGFGLMFGHSTGLIGTDLFFLNDIEQEGANPLSWSFFLFQLAFAGTSLTIVSGSMSERTAFIPYMCAALLMGGFIYPVFGHWAWGHLFFGGNKPWLAGLGFMDFAGSTVVHSIGAWVALVGAVLVGPRIGRYDTEGRVKNMAHYSIALSAFGLVLLWFGWWGFNGGSAFAADARVGSIIVNTNISAAFSALAAFFHCFLLQNRQDLYEKLIGGALGGLVAITASCNVVTPLGAVAIGLSTGIIHNYAFDLLLKKLRVDDPVGAIPIHGVCGVWGTMCVALFGQADMLSMDTRLAQLGVQMIGILAAAAWAIPLAYLTFKFLKMTTGLRVSPDVELEGICIDREFAYRKETLNADLEKILRAKLDSQKNT